MNGDQLRSAFERFFGEQWRIPAAAWLGVNVRTIERQVSGFQEVQGPIIAAVKTRAELEDIRLAWRRRQDRWRARGAKMPKFSRMVLENAAAGAHLLTGRPEGAKYVGIWEAATLYCINHGWLDDDRVITDLGRDALEKRP